MKKFSSITILESNSSYALLRSEITNYINKVNKRLPYNAQKALYLTQKYNLTNKSQLEEIKNSPKGKLSTLQDKYGISAIDMQSLWSLLKELKQNIRLLPQYQTEAERADIESGKLSVDDLTIDLKTQAGKNAAAKMYMPLVYTIVKQYIGKSRLDKSDLISAGLLGLTNAMSDWNPEGTKDSKAVSFKTYAAYRIKHQILDDIHKYSHTLSGTSGYAEDKYGASLLDAWSIDGLPKNDDGEIDQSKLAALGVQDLPKNEQKSWDELFKLIEKQFSQRDCDIFYRFFGLNGYKREKSKDIAKSYGMSEGNIRNSVLNKMIKWLKNNPKATDILQDIQDIYTESLMYDMMGMNKDQIIEVLASNDTYILLEELNKWTNANVYKRALAEALSKTPEIEDILKGDFNTIDSNIKKNRKLIILFLSNMYPSESFTRKTDVSIIDYMVDVQNAYHKFILKK